MFKHSLIFFLCIFPWPAQAAPLPTWEVGIASASLTLPHYMGSDQRYYAAIAAPYVIYRGEYFQFDRQGFHTSILEEGKLEIKANLSFGLPVSNNNVARQGMPSLRLSGEAGPQVVWNFRQRADSRMGIHLPWRAAMDIRGKYLGWVTEPTLQMAWYALGDRKQYGIHIKAGLLFASEKYQKYYYGVDPVYATASRPAFQAQQGLHSLVLSSRFTYRYDEDIDVGVFVRARHLRVGINVDSPLVKQPLYLGVGIGLTWKLWESVQ